jgi:outer membrane protein OmpA-like peptidoglycan-associated protein
LVSYGEEKPVAAGHSEAAWQQNRRVEIHYQPDSEMVSTLPAAVVQ